MQGWQCPACARIWSPFFSGPCPCSQAGAFEPYRITCDGGTTTDPADTTTDVTNAPVTPTAWLTNLRER